MRTGTREPTVRSLLHGAVLGTRGDADAAGLIAADIDSPHIDALISAAGE